jgi:hypothetical protein
MPGCDVRQNGAAAMDRSVMPSDLSVKAVGPVLGASENPAEPKPEKFTPPAQAPPTPPAVLVANPSLRFDPVSGLVVIEFHDQAGDVTTSIPTLRQLEAYRIWGEPVPSEDISSAGVHASATSKV